MLKLRVLKAISYLGLATIFFSAFLVFYQKLALDDFHIVVLLGTAMWLCTAPFWINKD